MAKIVFVSSFLTFSSADFAVLYQTFLAVRQKHYTVCFSMLTVGFKLVVS